MLKATFKKSILISVLSLASAVAIPGAVAGSLDFSPTTGNGLTLKSDKTDDSNTSNIQLLNWYPSGEYACEVDLCLRTSNNSCNGGNPMIKVIYTTEAFCATMGNPRPGEIFR